MDDCPTFHEIEVLLIAASTFTRAAALACRAWEHGGDAGAVGDTAASALEVAHKAQTAMRREDDAEGVPETRRAWLAEAAWCLLLAGTDEHGESRDLAISSILFRSTARA